MKDISLRIEVAAGAYLYDVLTEMVQLVARLQIPCSGLHNSRYLYVTPDADLDKVLAHYFGEAA